MDVLIVGPGAIARRHVENFRKAGADVVAVCGRDVDRSRAFAAELGISHAFASLDDALAAVDAPIVSVATPPASHHDITVAAVGAGRHVLCEKPFSMTAAEAASMVEAAERAGVLLGCWSSRHQFLWGLDNAIALAHKGAFGRVIQVHVDFQWRDLIPGLSYQPECPWFLDSAVNGGGVLVDWGSYWIDMILALLPGDRPMSVLGSTFLGVDRRPLPPGATVRDAEEVASAMVVFASGAHAVVQLASRVHGDIRHQMRVWGTDAGCVFNPFDAGPDAAFTLYRDRDGSPLTETMVAPAARSMHGGPALDFVQAVQAGRAPAAPGWRAAQVMAITEAIYQSAASGAAVTLAKCSVS